MCFLPTSTTSRDRENLERFALWKNERENHFPYMKCWNSYWNVGEKGYLSFGGWLPSLAPWMEKSPALQKELKLWKAFTIWSLDDDRFSFSHGVPVVRCNIARLFSIRGRSGSGNITTNAVKKGKNI